MTPLDAVNTAYMRAMGAVLWLVAGAGALGLGFLAAVAAIAAGLGFITAVIVGPWDLIVWLTKSDWRTTHFQAPVVGAIVGVAGLIVAHVSGTLFEVFSGSWKYANDLLKWRAASPEKSELQAILDTYKTPDQGQD